jgi:hypothetical protein
MEICWDLYRNSIYETGLSPGNNTGRMLELASLIGMMVTRCRIIESSALKEVRVTVPKLSSYPHVLLSEERTMCWPNYDYNPICQVAPEKLMTSSQAWRSKAQEACISYFSKQVSKPLYAFLGNWLVYVQRKGYKVLEEECSGYSWLSTRLYLE